jgi:hypothetical protein
MESVASFASWSTEFEMALRDLLRSQPERPISDVKERYEAHGSAYDTHDCDLAGVFTRLKSWLLLTDGSIDAIEGQKVDGRTYETYFEIIKCDNHQIDVHHRANVYLDSNGIDQLSLGEFYINKTGDGKFAVLLDNEDGIREWIEIAVDSANGIEPGGEGDEEDITYMFPDGIPDFYATPGMEGATFYGAEPNRGVGTEVGDEPTNNSV